MAKRRRRRRNPGATIGDYMLEHPWLTFFTIPTVFYSIAVMARGWPSLDKPSSSPVIVNTPPPQLATSTAPATVGDAEQLCAAMFG